MFKTYTAPLNEEKRKIMERPLSPHSNTTLNPKSYKYFGQRIPESLVSRRVPVMNRQSFRGLADECCTRPWSQLDYIPAEELSLRPQTTMAVYRPCFAEGEEHLKEKHERMIKDAYEAAKKEAEAQAALTGRKPDPVEPPEVPLPSFCFDKVPKRTLVSRLGTTDRHGYRRLPSTNYEMTPVTGPAEVSPLVPSKYEVSTKTFKVRNQSPKKTKPFSLYYKKADILKGPPEAPYAANIGPGTTGAYWDGGLETISKKFDLEQRRKALFGEFTVTQPNEGEYFGRGSNPHFLPPTDSKIAFGGSETFTGGHFERTCKPVQHEKWMRERDFTKVVPALGVTDKRMLLGPVVIK